MRNTKAGKVADLAMQLRKLTPDQIAKGKAQALKRHRQILTIFRLLEGRPPRGPYGRQKLLVIAGGKK